MLYASPRPGQSVSAVHSVLVMAYSYSLNRRMQSLGPTVPSPSMLKILRHSVSNYGLRSVYAGLSASLMRQMTYSLVRLGSYEKMKSLMSEDGRSPSAGKLLLAAGVAGGLGGIAGNPAGPSMTYCDITIMYDT
jgi:hypothetical protein